MVTFADISSSVSTDTLLNLLIKRKKKLPWILQTNLARWVARRSHRDFPHAFDNVESYCTFVERIADDSAVLTLRHENFVRDPESQLRNLCVWLGVDHSEDYLSACAGIVFESPHKSRYKVEWSPSDR